MSGDATFYEKKVIIKPSTSCIWNENKILKKEGAEKGKEKEKGIKRAR